ncbi:MAG: hypothetical protein QOD36_3028 [Mycobacterium sp.]|jgi:hypothetical protein|nr:hypothetical protein [Mycobacterium sp.]MDT5245652.1 hypothetical protein [Mycobacterium sp.]
MPRADPACRVENHAMSERGGSVVIVAVALDSRAPTVQSQVSPVGKRSAHG